MGNAGETRWSLERFLVGNNPTEERDKTNSAYVSNSDMQATINKQKSGDSKSLESDDQNKTNTINPGMNPRLEQDFNVNKRSPDLPITDVMSTPSPLNNAENNNQTEGEVIQEIEEGSSNASKSKISASI